MWLSRRVWKYTLLTVGSFGTIGTAISLQANHHLDSIGFVRFGRASFTALTIVIYYKQALYSKPLDPEAYAEMKSKVHKRSAVKLLELCCLNKGVFIKVGQHIGALDYILPMEYVETMKVLHSQAPSSTLDEVYKVISEDLRQNPDDIFENIDPTPIGTASLAQVHKAKLKDGSVIALKVQHPSVRGNSIVDMKTMEILAKIVSWVLPDFKMQWLVDETKRNIPKELDFIEEAKNTDKARSMFKHLRWLQIPKVHWNLCSKRVLALEFVSGGQVNDLDYIKKNKINPYEVSDKLGQLYSEMIFVKGFVHSDPHPGNILVKKAEDGKTNIVLLDHGLYANLSDDFRYKYARLWLSILKKNKTEMKKECASLGVSNLYWLFTSMISGRSWDAIQAGITTTKFDMQEKELFQKEVPNLLSYISEILTTVNRQMILILKTNDLLRGIEHTLNTYSRMESFARITRCCIKTVYTEDKKHCTSILEEVKLSCAEKWTLIKLFFYYRFLSIRETFLFKPLLRII